MMLNGLFMTAVGENTDSSRDCPNILWLTCEDIGQHLGCYGDPCADTPNLDGLAERGVIYTNAWSDAPVCAPARTGIITGVYAPSLGAQHMRSMVDKPSEVGMYPEHLRRAGYYCVNNEKEDYNLPKPGQVWNESSGQAHWKNRGSRQPFFSIFNYTVTHESGIRDRPHDLQHDPDEVRVPDYHPDTPEVRKDWAQYHDKITTLDGQIGEALDELEASGLADETIIFFYGDHGSGMPGQKRCARDAGLLVPMIVAVPPKYEHLAADDYESGGSSDRLVSFVDLAPTALSLCGIEPPRIMQGRAFMGEYEAEPRDYMSGFRGRMDERYDFVRCTRDKRYIYIRNFMPHLPMGQYIDYMFQTPTTQVWRQMYEAGELTEEEAAFWEARPPEELYDLQEDPDEVNNLAYCPDHQDVLERMRSANRQFMCEIRDLGFLPEPEIHRRSIDATPYEVGHDEGIYPLDRLMEAADAASRTDEADAETMAGYLEDSDCAVRYWGAMGLLMRGEEAVRTQADALREALSDESKSVQVAAAESLGRFGSEDDASDALELLVDLGNAEKQGPYVAMMALNAIDRMGERAAPALEQIRDLPDKASSLDRRVQYGIPNLLDKIVCDLES